MKSQYAQQAKFPKRKVTRKLINVIGRACRLPSAASIKEFRDLLFAEKCAIRRIPDDRWRSSVFHHPNPGTAGRSYSVSAGVVDDIFGFDETVFGISAREAELMDPQQRLLLHVVWEALEDAGIVPSDIAGSEVGVFVGASMSEHAMVLANDREKTDAYAMTGNALSLIANRISHVYDWHGPSVTVDTACSSSLYALSAAVDALNDGKIDVAVVGATNALLSPHYFVGFAAARMLSPTGLCQAFSANADGYVRGEGAVAFVLKRTAAAMPHAHGVIKHIELNTSGKTLNIAFPSVDAQFALLDRAYEASGVDPADLAFVEAHGTGTRVGDPIEAEALGRAVGRMRSTPLTIGSVKSNIGHLEPAAGCAGLLKALIALQERRLPATLHAENLNPDIPFSDLNLAVARGAIELSPGKDPLIAGISSFGFGGANAHCIVSAPTAPPPSLVKRSEVERPILLTSAFSRDALLESVQRYSDKLFDGAGRKQGDIFDGALHQRGRYQHRAAVVADTPKTVENVTKALAAGKSHPAIATAVSEIVDAPPVFLFSGNGCQYAGMCRAALESDPHYRDAFETISDSWTKIAGWSLLDMAYDDDLAEKLPRAHVAQPLLFADQVAFSRALALRGLQPAAVIGHSGGEVAAAHVAGALSLEQALRLNLIRSTVQDEFFGRGAMAALQAPYEAVQEVLELWRSGVLSVAAINSPKSVTIVGPQQDIDAFIHYARKAHRWACVRLKVDYPFHSPVQDEIESDLRDGLQGLRASATSIGFYSTVSGVMESGSSLDADYWWRNVRNPVRYRDAVESAVSDGFESFVEIGPDPVLTSYTRDTLSELGRDLALFHSGERRDTATVNPVLRTAARALVYGASIDTECLAARPDRPVRDLPSYPFQLREFRAFDSRTITRISGAGSEFHPLLGIQQANDTPFWNNEVDAQTQPVLADHFLAGRSIMPGMALAEMALAATHRILKSERIELFDADFTAPIHLSTQSMLEIRTIADDRSATIQVSTRPRFGEGEWEVNAICRYLPTCGHSVDAEAPVPSKSSQSAEKLYRLAHRAGLDYGPFFQRISHWQMPDKRTLEVFLKSVESEEYRPDDYELEPVGADAVLHGLIAHLEGSAFADQGLGFVPVRAGRIVLLRRGREIASGRLRILSEGKRSLNVEVTYFDAEGAMLARFEDLRLKAARLFRPIAFSKQSFFIERKPIIQASDEVLPTKFAERLTLELRSESALGAADQEAILLLDAAARRIWYDTLLEFSAPSDIGRKLPDIAVFSSDAQHYVRQVLAGLSAAGIAEKVDKTWRLIGDPTLPSADELLTGLQVERPDLGLECAVLARLARALPGLLKGQAEWNRDAIFGAGMFKTYCRRSSLLAARRKWLSSAVKLALDEIGKKRPVRIAELTHVDEPRILLDIMLGPRLVQGSFAQIVFDRDIGSAGYTENAQDMAPVDIVHVDALADIEAFDLIVSAEAHDPECVKAGLKDQISNRLRPGGVAVLLSPELSDYLTALSPFIGQTSGSVSAYASDHRADGVQRLTVKSAGATATIETASTAAQQNKTLPRMELEAVVADSAPTDAPAALRAIAKRWRETVSLSFDRDAALWFAAFPARENSGGFICVFAESEAEDAQLASRILRLGEFMQAAPENGLPLWCIVPGGAGYAGVERQLPGQAALWAFLKTAQNEYPLIDIRMLDASPSVDSFAIAEHFLTLIDSGTDETEIVVDENGIGALRVRQGALSANHRPPLSKNTRAVLNDDPSGGLDKLTWRLEDMGKLDENSVRIEVKAIGLNYRDVMWAMDLLPEEALEGGFAGASMGIECSGLIVAVGSKVKGLSKGDEVVTFGPSCLSSCVDVPVDLCTRLPGGFGHEAAATVPVAFFTAYYGLVKLANLQRGESVLIHGGAGGVGLAAIQIAHWRGARIIATAGNPTKRAFLESLGVDHVLNSRSLDFVEQVRDITDGEGVDVVLNSLAKSGMEQSLNLLAPFGRFLELGKQDFYKNSAIGVRPLRKNNSYFAIDIDDFMARFGEQARGILGEVLDGFERGDFVPLVHQSFHGFDAIEGFRTMQRSDHIGKIVIRPVSSEHLSEWRDDRLLSPDPERWIVIAGGGSGVGLSIADRLAEKGARRIALIGRSPVPQSHATEVIERNLDAEIRYVSCDITDLSALEETLSELRTVRPIAGVIHSAMFLDDMRIADLTRDVVERTLAPKVAGTKNLDIATREDRLDYFVAFSSMATLIGNHGQSAYVAANAYLEAVMRRRREEGLPGIAVGWGAISDVGYLTRNAAAAEMLRRFGGGVEFTSNQMLRAFEQLAADGQNVTDQTVLWVSPMSWSTAGNTLELLKGPTYGALAKLGRQGAHGQSFDNIRDELSMLPSGQAIDQLAEFIKSEIARILRCPANTLPRAQPVGNLGLDSLMSVELGLAIQEALGADIPMMSMAASLSIDDISSRIVRHIQSSDVGEGANAVLAEMTLQHFSRLTEGQSKDAEVAALDLSGQLRVAE